MKWFLTITLWITADIAAYHYIKPWHHWADAHSLLGWICSIPVVILGIILIGNPFKKARLKK